MSQTENSTRADAQDEGAAGEASAYRVRMISNDPAEWVLMHPEKALDLLSRKGWESQPLYAHPSPTPADADRVRKAYEIAMAEHDHWVKEALKHKRPKGLRSDCENRDLERARIAKRIADKIAALKPTAEKEDNNVSTN